MLGSSLCKEIDFSSGWFHRWATETHGGWILARKVWEHAYICQALYERGMLSEGKRGLGFAVGTEPLPSLFATYGASILATDIDVDSGTEKGWTNQNQLCFGLGSLNTRGICPPELFEKNVQYRTVNMNSIPTDLVDFDFNWSSCSFEHLGGIQPGIDFVINQMKTIKVGGIAVHTSEYNISSDTETLETENLTVFRQRDYLEMVRLLREAGHKVEPLDFSLGWMPTDFHYDVPPYGANVHTRLLIDKYICSSFGLIITKGK